MSSQLSLERTLAIIKPHAICNRFAILRRIQMAGFHVLQERCVKLTVEQAKIFLRHKSNDTSEIETFCSGPLIVLALARGDAVESWKRLMGPELSSVARNSSPTSLRALYGDELDDLKNAVHGSQSTADVKHELSFFFPNMNVEQHFELGQTNEYLSAVIYQPLTDALHEMTKAKPDDPLAWLASFMLEHNKNKPTICETSPEFIRKLKEIEEVEQKRRDDDGPSACGCVISQASSNASLSNARCCSKPH